MAHWPAPVAWCRGAVNAPMEFTPVAAGQCPCNHSAAGCALCSMRLGCTVQCMQQSYLCVVMQLLHGVDPIPQLDDVGDTLLARVFYSPEHRTVVQVQGKLDLQHTSRQQYPAMRSRTWQCAAVSGRLQHNTAQPGCAACTESVGALTMQQLPGNASWDCSVGRNLASLYIQCEQQQAVLQWAPSATSSTASYHPCSLHRPHTCCSDIPSWLAATLLGAVLSCVSSDAPAQSSSIRCSACLSPVSRAVLTH